MAVRKRPTRKKPIKKKEPIKKPVKKTPVKKSSKKTKIAKKDDIVVKDDNRSPITAFYAKNVLNVEKITRMVGGAAKYLEPISTGNLCTDWLFNGGVFNGMSVTSGMEQSGKTTLVNHLIASSIKHKPTFSHFFDAEGTLNPDLADAIFTPYGISLNDLDKGDGKNSKSPWKYYRYNVIETIFNHMHLMLKLMPDKIWLPDQKTWAYIFNKNDKKHKLLMEVYNVEADSKLSVGSNKFICPTDHDSVEGAFFIDSYAAMVTLLDDDGETKTKQRSPEAAAFSNNLKRVSARLSNKGVALVGINQTRENPNSRGGFGPQLYEPGGKALGFYSSQRARLASRSSGFKNFCKSKYDKDAKRFTEKSVLVDGQKDHYDYKIINNTKNKPGNPNKSTWGRIWVADHTGNGAGFDPAYDTFQYLIESKQLKKSKKKWKFDLKKSVGKQKADMLNSLDAFDDFALKRLVLSERFNSRELTKDALAVMGLNKKVNLREALFKQLKIDKEILAIKTKNKEKENEEDYENDVTQL